MLFARTSTTKKVPIITWFIVFLDRTHLPGGNARSVEIAIFHTSYKQRIIILKWPNSSDMEHRRINKAPRLAGRSKAGRSRESFIVGISPPGWTIDRNRSLLQQIMGRFNVSRTSFSSSMAMQHGKRTASTKMANARATRRDEDIPSPLESPNGHRTPIAAVDRILEKKKERERAQKRNEEKRKKLSSAGLRVATIAPFNNRADNAGNYRNVRAG